MILLWWLKALVLVHCNCSSQYILLNFLFCTVRFGWTWRWVNNDWIACFWLYYSFNHCFIPPLIRPSIGFSEFDFLSVLFYFSISPSTSRVFKMPCSVTIPFSLLLSLWPSLFSSFPNSVYPHPFLSPSLLPVSLSMAEQTFHGMESM